jgi:CLIP-associating protein 1/2
MFRTLKPEFVWEKISAFWSHRSWKVRHGLLEVVAEVVSVLGSSLIPMKDQSNAVLRQVLKLLEDNDG